MILGKNEAAQMWPEMAVDGRPACGATTARRNPGDQRSRRNRITAGLQHKVPDEKS